jgi:hypothetical protein
VPDLEKEAERLEAAAATGENWGVKLVADFTTIGELANAIGRHHHAGSPSYVSPEKIKAHEARMAAQSAKSEAVRILTETADPEVEREIVEAMHQIQSLQRRIADRRPITTLEERISAWSKKIENLSAGKRPDYTIDPRYTGDLLNQAKEEWRDLISMRPMVAQAQAENDVDQSKIASLEKKISVLLERKMNPKCLKWSE